VAARSADFIEQIKKLARRWRGLFPLTIFDDHGGAYQRRHSGNWTFFDLNSVVEDVITFLFPFFCFLFFYFSVLLILIDFNRHT
jgi:hypothetical protein